MPEVSNASFGRAFGVMPSFAGIGRQLRSPADGQDQDTVWICRRDGNAAVHFKITFSKALPGDAVIVGNGTGAFIAFIGRTDADYDIGVGFAEIQACGGLNRGIVKTPFGKRFKISMAGSVVIGDSR